jgi:hypothetical protein
VSEQEHRPGNLYAADDEAREVTEQLIRDAGYDPVDAGGLDNARALEDFLGPLGATGPKFYRFGSPRRALVPTRVLPGHDRCQAPAVSGTGVAAARQAAKRRLLGHVRCLALDRSQADRC